MVIYPKTVREQGNISLAKTMRLFKVLSSKTIRALTWKVIFVLQKIIIKTSLYPSIIQLFMSKKKKQRGL